jgi:hypothetical protein
MQGSKEFYVEIAYKNFAQKQLTEQAAIAGNALSF